MSQVSPARPRLHDRPASLESLSAAGGDLGWTAAHLPIDSEAIMKAIFSLVVCGLAVTLGDAVDPVGTWKCEYEIGGMKRMSTLNIKKEADKLAGTMSWPDQKEAKLKNVKLKDGHLTFSAVREFMGNKIDIEYKLTIDVDNFKGKGTSDFGGQKQEFDIAGKREKK